MRALLVVFAASACGRVGFGARPSPGDGASSDGVDGSGSGVPAQFVPPWHSGSRLRARTLVGGGDPIFYGWHDTQLDSDCQPTIAGDGMERCMPYGARADQIYSDAACTQPLALVYVGTCGKNGYAFADNGGTHEYAIGAPYFGTIYSKSPTCAATSLPPTQQAYRLGVEEPPTSFVVSSYHRQTIGSFEHSFNDFADGATIDTGELELASSACNPVATEVGPVRCRTITPRATPAYADAGCTQPILAWERTPYDPPATDLLAVYPPQACDSSYTLYQTIADVTAPQYWVRDAGGCSLITTGTSVVLYTATAIADPAPMGTVSRGPDRGRIGTFYWTGSDNIAIPVGSFDQQLGTPCTPFNAADGVLRCLPSQPVIETALEDATCTGVPQSLFGACFAAPPVDGPGYSSCFDAPWHVHSLPTTVPVASHFDATSCVTIEWPGGVGYEQQTTGAELPASMFPALTELVE